MLAKANMGEWAFSPLFSVSSAAGIVRNPYDTDRVPAGSSGGVAAGALGVSSRDRMPDWNCTDHVVC